MTRPLYIFDLDGTLALIEHRRPYVALHPGAAVMVQGKLATYVGPNEKVPGDYRIDHGPGIGTYSWHPSDVKFKPDWDGFYAACVDDAPNVPVIKTLKHLCQYGAETWIFSGRSDVVRAETLAWLTQHTRMSWEKTSDRPVFMRKHKDYTPDDVLKKQWLDAMLPKDRERLVAVFEDRDRMVKMWRANGVACYQVAPGDF